MTTLKQVLLEQFKEDDFIYLVYGRIGGCAIFVKDLLKQERTVNSYKVVKVNGNSILVK